MVQLAEISNISEMTALFVAIGVVINSIIALIAAVLSALGRRENRIMNTRIEDKTDAIEKKTDTVHGLVNGQMHHVLKANSILAEKYAAMTGDPQDKKVAAEAKAAFEEHVATVSVATAISPEAMKRPTVVETMLSGNELKREVITKKNEDPPR